jgi:hypothetical protein
MRFFFSFEQQAIKKWRGLGEWRWMNILYEGVYKCMKLEKDTISKKEWRQPQEEG